MSFLGLFLRKTPIFCKKVLGEFLANQGLLEKRRLLEYVNNFIVFEDDKGTLTKKIAGYHQYHAVLKAVKTTIEASRPDGKPVPRQSVGHQ